MADLPLTAGRVILQLDFSVGSPGPKYTELSAVAPDASFDLSALGEAWSGFLSGRLYTNDLASAQLNLYTNVLEASVSLDIESKSGDYLPLNTSLLVRKVGEGIGRKNRGRMFLPAVVGEAESDGSGLVSPTLLTNINTGLGALFTDYNGASADPVILHADGSVPTRITYLAAQPLLATQRRRLRR